MGVLNRLDGRVVDIPKTASEMMTFGRMLLEQEYEAAQQTEKERTRADKAESALAECRLALADSTAKLQAATQRQAQSDAGAQAALAEAAQLRQQWQQAQTDLQAAVQARAEAQAAAAADASARSAVESLLESERRARQEADKRVTTMVAELCRPEKAKEKERDIVHPKGWTFEVARRDSAGNISSIRANPQE